MKKNTYNGTAVAQFLSILRAGLWDRDIDMSPFEEGKAPDWKGILQIGRTQAVLPLLYDGMLKLPEGMRLKGAALMQLIAYVDKVENHNRELNTAIVEISRRFSEAGIKSVLLKGQGNALWYEHPEHRQCGDMDIWVGPENFDKAAAIVRSWSEMQGEKPGDDKHIGFYFNHLLLELHREAFFFPVAGQDDRYRPWERAELGGEGCLITLGEGEKSGQVRVPPLDFNFFYIFCHAFQHFMEVGLGLRQFCDIARFIHRFGAKIDSNAFQNRLKEYKLDKEWSMFACILTDYLGLPSDNIPLWSSKYSAIAEKLLNQIFEDGNFGHHNGLPDFSRKSFLIRKSGNLWIHHAILVKRLKFSLRQSLLYYRLIWTRGIKRI